MLTFKRIQEFLSTVFYIIANSTSLITRSHRSFIAASYDLCAVIIAWTLAYWVLIDTMADITVSIVDKLSMSILLVSSYWKPVLINLIWILPIQLLLFRLFGLYRGFWRFASTQDLKKILYVSFLGGIIAWITLRASSTGELFGVKISEKPYLNEENMSHFILLPRYITALLYSVFLVSLLSSARLFVRFAKDYKYLYHDYRRVIIVGAGNAGEGLVRDLLREETHRYKPLGFVDDDLRKLGREIHSIRVLGTISELPTLIKKYNIDLVLIAIPSASSSSMRSVVNVCEQANVHCYTLPGIKDLTNGRISINILRNISLEDLLGRFPVSCKWELIQQHLLDKTIVITGGGGSIGSELCRQIASLGNNTRLIIVDNNEYNLYSIEMELRRRFPQYTFYPLLLSILDREGIQFLFKKYRPDFVFHAAAYKHVPLLEQQPRIAMYNNIIGTAILAEEASHFEVKKFVLISTDKAVNPTNIMGATKRAAEYLCQNMNYQKQATQFITVRFGNVLDSAGSVVPLFRKQIEQGGPVTVTHPEITRFFMTIPEASQLILQAAFLGHGGEIFVLDMGDPIKISYLAEQMIKLAGKTVDKDIKIIFTGLRPGEKLYEECFYSDEFLKPTQHTKILKAQSPQRNFEEILTICAQIKSACNKLNNDKELLDLLKQLVPEYNFYDNKVLNQTIQNVPEP